MRLHPVCFVFTLSLLAMACGRDEDLAANSSLFEEPSPRSEIPPPTATAPPLPTATATATVHEPEPTLSLTPTPTVSAPTPTCDPAPSPSATEQCWIFDDSCPPPGRERCEPLYESARGWRPDFSPSLPNDSCDYASNYAQPSELTNGDAEELHVISVYEGYGAEHGPHTDERVAGVVQIVVHARPRPIVLALSSYEPVRWQIDLEPGARLSRVVAQGYYEQTVEGIPDGVPLLRLEACDCAYGWEVERNRGGCNYRVAIADVRALTGLHESSFQGCYAGGRFEVPYWSGDAPTERPTPIVADETLPPRDVDLAGCESVTAESQYCLTATSRGISVLGLDSGALCDVTSTSAPLGGGYTSSLAWRGELLYACTNAGLIRVSLRDGSWEAAQVACEAVADFDGGLLLMGDYSDSHDYGTLRSYRDYAAVLELAPERTFNQRPFATRMAVHGERLYGAWHATDTIEVVDLDLDEPIGVLGLENYDDWIWGIAVTADGELVLTNGRDRVVLFDLQTGVQIRELSLSEHVFGLACTERDAPPFGTPTPASTPDSPTSSGTVIPRSADLPSCEELTAAISPAERAELAPSIPIEKNCAQGGSGSSNYANPEKDLVPGAAAELHVVSVYEGKSNPGFHAERQGVVEVNVRPRPKPIVLVLASSAPTIWRLHMEEGAILERVITQGYGAQVVEGLPECVHIEHREPESTCGYAYGWEIGNGGGSYPLFIADVRAYTGLIETSFQGCSQGAEFDVPHWDENPPTERRTPLPLDEGVPREEVEFPGCEEVTSERLYCLTIAGGGPALVGLDTGAICFLSSSLSVSPDTSSIAWRGEAMYACSYETGLARVSLIDGAVELAQIPCEAVTDYGQNLLLAESWGSILELPSYDALLAGSHAAVHDAGGSTRMTVRGDTLYTAWHSTDEIERYDLASGEPLPPITLENYDGWILGMAVTDDGQLAIVGDTWGDTIRIFDAETGAELRTVRPETYVSGLSCVTGQ